MKPGSYASMIMVMANQLIVKVVMSFKPTSGHMSYNETTVSAMTDIMSETSTKQREYRGY